jgi:hypothetical protein
VYRRGERRIPSIALSAIERITQQHWATIVKNYIFVK